MTLSFVFGVAILVINPPLRGPDEQAHFVRIYAYAHGEFIPSVESKGMKGTLLPPAFYDDNVLFNSVKFNIQKPGFNYRGVFAEYRKRQLQPAADRSNTPMFVPFEGSESYTVVAYAPYVVAGIVARLLDLNFVDSLYLMRAAGLVFFTAVAAYAILIVPWLKWAFVLIALIPTTLYARTVLGADAATVSFSMVVVALCLRAVAGQRSRLDRSVWMTLCVLSKPPQIAFILLEPMLYRWRALGTKWRTIAIVILPAIGLTLLWLWLVDAEMAAWRQYADGLYKREYFTLPWKLGFMLENPFHFPRVMGATFVHEWFALWQQLIGILGWLDTPLDPWINATFTGLLLVTMLERLEVSAPARIRLVGYSMVTAAGYVVAVLFILFVTWTPPTEEEVWGVQGRYFLCLLPLVAVIVSALCRKGLPESGQASAAIIGGTLSGVACIEAIWRVNWVGLP
ncbi:MAG: DUF2142 domain-containing protein [Variibacter sp.]